MGLRQDKEAQCLGRIKKMFGIFAKSLFVAARTDNGLDWPVGAPLNWRQGAERELPFLQAPRDRGERRD